MRHFKTIRWGIIGVGDVTEVKSGPAFYKLEHSELVAVMRRDARKAADYARRHGVASWYAGAPELIDDPRVDAVYVATPPDSHAHYAIEAMRAGKPVYVEKPMARTHAECVEMLRVSKQTGMPLWVAYYRRALPAFVQAVKRLDAGEIGKPLMVNIRLYKRAAEQPGSPLPWRVDPEIAGAGHFYDLASHQFDYLDMLLGEVTRVQGSAANIAGLYAAEDTVTASWIHASGVVGSGSWCFAVDDHSELDEIRVTGTLGEITLSSFEHPERLVVKTGRGESTLHFDNPPHISQNLVQQVVDELRGYGRCVSTGESGARTNWVLEQVVSDYYSDKSA